MNSTLIQSSFDSDGDQKGSTEAIPRLSTSAYETPDFGSGAKRQKVIEDDKKAKGGDGDALVETEDDDADEIEDGDDEDDFMEVKQYTPKRTMREKCSEDDERFQRYLNKVIDSEGFDLDEDPLNVYPFTGVRVCRLTYVDTLTANYAVQVGYVYFITFRARKNSSSEVKTYQAEVSHDLWGDMVVNKFQEKAQ
ncbi:unnamed protein product [Linum tenue]|uniref:Cystatin domain-containing protein n=1 Tax=Linum tenue TaxID=586396 RepID=A0AAV0PRP8_9ROSI|nr:unnamed protein product [Linum tenue]